MKKHEIFTVVFAILVLAAVLWAIYPSFQDNAYEPTQIDPKIIPFVMIGWYGIAILIILLWFGLSIKYRNKSMEENP